MTDVKLQSFISSPPFRYKKQTLNTSVT